MLSSLLSPLKAGVPTRIFDCISCQRLAPQKRPFCLSLCTSQMSLTDNEATCTERWRAWLSPLPRGEEADTSCASVGSASSISAPERVLARGGSCQWLVNHVRVRVGSRSPKLAVPWAERICLARARPQECMAEDGATRTHEEKTPLADIFRNAVTKSKHQAGDERSGGVTVAVKAGDPRLRAADRQDKRP